MGSCGSGSSWAPGAAAVTVTASSQAASSRRMVPPGSGGDSPVPRCAHGAPPRRPPYRYTAHPLGQDGRMRVAFLGLGRMGAPMAAHVVAAGHDVTVWNRTPGRAVDGARTAPSIADAVRDAEAVITML